MAGICFLFLLAVVASIVLYVYFFPLVLFVFFGGIVFVVAAAGLAFGLYHYYYRMDELDREEFWDWVSDIRYAVKEKLSLD